MPVVVAIADTVNNVTSTLAPVGSTSQDLPLKVIAKGEVRLVVVVVVVVGVVVVVVVVVVLVC